MSKRGKKCVSDRQLSYNRPPKSIGRGIPNKNTTDPQDYHRENIIKIVREELEQALTPEIKFTVPQFTISTPAQVLNLSSERKYIITSQIGCLYPEFIDEFHLIFKKRALTSTKFIDFAPHFITGETTARRIFWLWGINLLTFTFDYLQEKLIPTHPELFRILSNHFCDSEGNDYSPDQLRKNHSKGVDKTNNKEMIKAAFLPLIKKATLR